MIITVTVIRHHFKGHQTLIKTIHHPHILERILTLGLLKRKRVDYLGAKKTWYSFPGMKPITNAELIEELEAIELKGRVIRGASTTKHVPLIVLKR